LKRYALKRLLYGLITIVGVFIIVFFISRLSGDVTYLLMPQDATALEEAAIRAELGLDRPIIVQLVIFLGKALNGDFGDSIRYNQPAIDIVLERLPATFELAFSAFIFALII
jgi:peptide/nickel transport system permease protein